MCHYNLSSLTVLNPSVIICSFLPVSVIICHGEDGRDITTSSHVASPGAVMNIVMDLRRHPPDNRH